MSECTKKAYSSTMEAYLALEIIQTKGRLRDTTPTRYYFCQKCKKYHLTSSKNIGGKYNPEQRESQRKENQKRINTKKR
jgi:hypothetical protein